MRIDEVHFGEFDTVLNNYTLLHSAGRYVATNNNSATTSKQQHIT